MADTSDEGVATLLLKAQVNVRELLGMVAISAPPEVLESLTSALSSLNDAEAELLGEAETEEVVGEED